MSIEPESASRAEVLRRQGKRLSALLRAALPANRFWARKFAAAGLDPAAVRSPADLARLPFTTKAELADDQAEHPPYGSNLTFSSERYIRLCQTSGTTSGQPLRWLDTAESWQGALDCWAAIYRVVGLRPGVDRLFFPFSFGPFLAFWSAFDAAAREGYLALPGGGMASTTRLRFLLDHQATVVLSTPTYALRLAEVAHQEGIDLRGSAVRALIVAGEPGGSVPGTRRRLEEGWGARVFDHSGMTEVGPLAVECPANPGGLHVLEEFYVAEVVDPETGAAVSPGTPGELVLSNLYRAGSPLLRYRTGDLVCVDPRPCPCGLPWLRLDGGIRGRLDDMIVLRGNNVYPSALQAILHRFAEVVEYRIEVDRSGPLASLGVELEVAAAADAARVAARVDQAIRDELLFRAAVRVAPPGSLPRFELKARRVVEKNESGDAAEGPGR
jgi:phenylacetate-CoA ligase